MAVTTASAFLGLTLGCARCHDHKFDAIPTRDYYRLQCAFTTTAPADVKLKDEALKRELTIRAITEKPQPADTWLLARGDFFSKKEKLQLGFFTVLTSSKTPEDYLAAARREVPAPKTTLQRRALADWMTDVEQGAGPLLARVMVNRVWQHHFGEGLVAHRQRLRRPRRTADASRSCWNGWRTILLPEAGSSSGCTGLIVTSSVYHAGRCGIREANADRSRQSAALAAAAAAVGGRDSARRRAGRQRHAELAAVRSRLQAADSRRGHRRAGIPRIPIPRMPRTLPPRAGGPSTCSTSGSCSIR